MNLTDRTTECGKLTDYQLKFGSMALVLRRSTCFRSEFRVWHEGNQCDYIMFDKVCALWQPSARLQATAIHLTALLSAV